VVVLEEVAGLSTLLKVFRFLGLPSQSAWARAALVALLELGLYQRLLARHCSQYK
jgi:hypothetical protein